MRPERPQLAQLVEHQRRIGGLGLPQSRLQPLQHLLHARGRAFLLLDAVLEALHLVLHAAVGFLELGAIAEQVQHAGRLRPRAWRAARAEPQEAELSDELMSGAMIRTRATGMSEAAPVSATRAGLAAP